jgi:hypothetical protein
MSSTTKPDFGALRKKRNDEIWKVLEITAKKFGCKPENLRHNFNFDACYCACPTGPCEHNFKGWRAFAHGGGGETVCERCGMGAMSHSLRTAE